MLLLAVVGVGLQLPAIYWILVMPVYAVICIDRTRQGMSTNNPLKRVRRDAVLARWPR